MRNSHEKTSVRSDSVGIDTADETEFWKYYRSDSIHSFYPTGSKEEAQAFETPWWLLESPA